MKSRDPEMNRRATKILRHKPTIRRSPFQPCWECIGRGVVANGSTVILAHAAWEREYHYRNAGRWNLPGGSLFPTS